MQSRGQAWSPVVFLLLHSNNWTKTSQLQCTHEMRSQAYLLQRGRCIPQFLFHENWHMWGLCGSLKHGTRWRHTMKQKMTKAPDCKGSQMYNWKSDTGKNIGPKELANVLFFFSISRKMYYFLLCLWHHSNGRRLSWKEGTDCNNRWSTKHWGWGQWEHYFRETLW